MSLTFTLDQCEIISTICKPLFSRLEFNNFDYSRVYIDGSRAHLGCNPKLIEHTFSETKNINQAYWYPALPTYRNTALMSRQINRYLPEQFKSQLKQQWQDEKEKFGIADTLLVFQVHPDYVELFNFSCPENFDLSEFIIGSQLELLFHFNHYFRDQAHELIQAAEAHKVVTAWRNPDGENCDLLDQQRCTFRKQTPIKRFYLDNQYRDTYLTPSEVRVAQHLIQGQSNKSIARQLAISDRTVETHINHLKEKLACFHRDQLIKVLAGNASFF